MTILHLEHVMTSVEIESLEDRWDAERGFITPAKVRRVTLRDAHVDPSETHLCLPSHLIQALGLHPTGARRTTSYARFGTAELFAAVRVTIADQSCSMDVLEIDLDAPAVIGNLVLTHFGSVNV
jgi:hypothetical protein